MVSFLRDLFDMSVPGQQVNAVRQQRQERAAAEQERERQAQAYQALQSGDVMGAAAYNPGLANSYQGVLSSTQNHQRAQDAQAALKQGDVMGAALHDPRAAGEYQQVQAQQAANQQQSGANMRNAALRATRAAKQAVAQGGDPLQVFDTIAGQAGSLFTGQEDLAEARGLVEQYGSEAFNMIEQGFTDPQKRGTPAKPFAAQDADGNTVYVQADPVTGELSKVEGFRPLDKASTSGDPLGDAIKMERLSKIQRDNAAAERQAEIDADPDLIQFKFGSEAMTRAALNLPNVIAANEKMDDLYSQGVRYNTGKTGVAASVAGNIPLAGEFLERAIGDDNRDLLVQAASSYEAALLPILSGAAVTETEAMRTYKASVPQPGDSDAMLQAKAKHRLAIQQMIEAGVSGKPFSRKALREGNDRIEAMYEAEKKSQGSDDKQTPAEDAPAETSAEDWSDDQEQMLLELEALEAAGKL